MLIPPQRTCSLRRHVYSHRGGICLVARHLNGHHVNNPTKIPPLSIYLIYLHIAIKRRNLPNIVHLSLSIPASEKYLHKTTSERFNMCNGTSSRTSQGGTIVILQTKLPSRRPQLKRELSLKLSADIDNGQTIATFDGLESHLGGSHFVIQSVDPSSSRPQLKEHPN